MWSVTVALVDTNYTKWTWKLNQPWKALYIPEMIWDEQVYNSKDSILLVLSNTLYDPSDYIEDYDEFRRLKNESK